jgi:hypothetical protein
MMSRVIAGVIIGLFLFSLVAGLCVIEVEGQGLNNGRFPADGTWNGMVITYGIQGAELSNPVQGEGSLAFEGIITGDTLTLSGKLHQENGWGADAVITLGAFGEETSVRYEGRLNETVRSWDQDFRLTIEAPPGSEIYQFGGFTIHMDGLYNDGPRGFDVEADLTREVSQGSVDHIVVSSPYTSVRTGDGSFTVTATVFQLDNSFVPDDTRVTFSLSDRQGGSLGGASIALPPNGGYTVGGVVTATFFPPGSSYWDDPVHVAGAGSIDIIAYGGGDKQGVFTIQIYNSDNDSSGDGSHDTLPTGQISAIPLEYLIVGVAVLVVIVVGAFLFLRSRSGSSKYMEIPPPPPPPPP